jgi:hypothetical protein
MQDALGLHMMGKITTQLVVTGSERRDRPKTIQPGNREWVTTIAAINAAGWSVPLFIIFAGQYHLSAWYEDAEIPRDWVIVQEGYFRYCLIYSTNIYVLSNKVVEKNPYRGAQSWWGASLACPRHSLIQHVMSI